jgi:hypothetical protein
MLTQDEAIQNLTAIANEIPLAYWDNGAAWYTEAHEWCLHQSRLYSKPLHAVVGCLAVLSPNCSWTVNKEATISMLQTGNCTQNVYPRNVEKAYQIVYNQADPIETMMHPRYGRKIRAFYNNILSPETSQDVTVDTHAIRAAHNRYDLTRSELRRAFESKLGHATIHSAYQTVANALHIQPHKFQAAVWLYVKDTL